MIDGVSTRYILSAAFAAARRSQTGVRLAAVPESALDQDEARERVIGDADGADDHEFRHGSHRGETKKAGTFAESTVDEQYRRGKGACDSDDDVMHHHTSFYLKRKMLIIKKDIF